MFAFKLLNLIISITIKINLFVSIAITALNQRLMSPPTLMLSLLFKKINQINQCQCSLLHT